MTDHLLHDSSEGRSVHSVAWTVAVGRKTCPGIVRRGNVPESRMLKNNPKTQFTKTNAHPSQDHRGDCCIGANYLT